jgi:hypothetical protein
MGFSISNFSSFPYNRNLFNIGVNMDICKGRKRDLLNQMIGAFVFILCKSMNSKVQREDKK